MILQPAGMGWGLFPPGHPNGPLQASGCLTGLWYRPFPAILLGVYNGLR
jgi:hypothetical protein